MCNISGVLHSGALSTMLDFGTTVAILTFDKRNRGTASAEISLSYLSSVRPGSEIYILSQINRIGRHVAFSHSTIYSVDGEVLAIGRQMKKFNDFSYYFDGEDYIYAKSKPTE